jgi:phosphoribosylanthranilate isomerase
MKIKVCGMRETANIKALSELQPDYMGLIFYAASKRFVNKIDLSFTDEKYSKIKLTGVFVNENKANILLKVRQYNLQAIQLHGNESPEFCSSLRTALHNLQPNLELIKAFGLDKSFEFSVLDDFVPVVDFFLFDTKTPGHGGSGKKFDWTILNQYKLQKPFFLSGGIGFNNLQELGQINDYRFYGVDLNSKFEISPGLKDIEKISRAISDLRQI